MDQKDCLKHSNSAVCRINLDGPYVAVKLLLGNAGTYPKST
ncbi:hypothetical protein [Prochlorococcus marinus]|nr:hypothetical protein [Prochlorococcus marinus]